MSVRPHPLAALLALAALAGLLGAGCARADGPREIEPGVTFFEADQPTVAGTRTHLWVYLPAHPAGKLPCVVIAPAGTPLIWGMDLGDGDRPEHLPYVRAGFAVVAYSIDGPVSEHPSDDEILRGFVAFRKAHAGVSDAYAALDYVRAHLPQVDPARVYVAGHSSAATLALLTAESDSRVKGCVAYAPPCDVVARQAGVIPVLEGDVPDIRAFLTRTSPLTKASGLRCPLFLFHADDDGNVPTADVSAFAQSVGRTNSRVTFVQVPTGGHYDSMIHAGIPRAITWLRSLGGSAGTP